MEGLQIVRITVSGEGENQEADIELPANAVFTDEELNEVIETLAVVSKFITSCMERTEGRMIQ